MQTSTNHSPSNDLHDGEKAPYLELRQIWQYSTIMTERQNSRITEKYNWQPYTYIFNTSHQKTIQYISDKWEKYDAKQNQ